MKKIITLCICFTMMLTLGACQNKREEDTPVKVTAAFLDAYSKKDKEKVKEFSKWEDSTVKALEIQESDYIVGVDKDLQKDVYNKMQAFKHEEGKEEIKEDSATVKVTLSLYDFAPAIKVGLKEATSKAEEISHQEDITDAKAQSSIHTVMFQNLNKAKMTLKKDVVIKLVKEDGEWYVTADNKDFQDVLISNVQSLTTIEE